LARRVGIRWHYYCPVVPQQWFNGIPDKSRDDPGTTGLLLPLGATCELNGERWLTDWPTMGWLVSEAPRVWSDWRRLRLGLPKFTIQRKHYAAEEGTVWFFICLQHARTKAG